MKRFFLFVATNIMVVTTISIILSVTGLNGYFSQQLGTGGNLLPLLIFCSIWGFGGAFISLMISKFIAKRSTGAQNVEDHPEYRWLVEMVHNSARRANLPKMPEVAVYNSPDPNAFATGPSRSNSLVAVSTGLLNSMNRDAIEGVIGHEVAHIANGDMVTMTLLQGVLNSFTMFLSRVATMIIDNALQDEDGRGGLGFFARMAVVSVFDMVFGLMAMPILAWFSRHREYRADSGSAQLTSKPKMLAALSALQSLHPVKDEMPKNMRAMQINGHGSFAALFSTHPPLEKRIEALSRQH